MPDQNEHNDGKKPGPTMHEELTSILPHTTRNMKE